AARGTEGGTWAEDEDCTRHSYCAGSMHRSWLHRDIGDTGDTHPPTGSFTRLSGGTCSMDAHDNTPAAPLSGAQTPAPGSSLSRKGFLKGAATVAGAVAAGPVTGRLARVEALR